MNFKEKEKKDKLQFLKQFGEHTRQVRLKQKVSGAQLASRLFMEQSNLTRIEKGGINLSVYQIKKICEALEMSFEKFFHDFKY